jgi:hypothetical protein
METGCPQPCAPSNSSGQGGYAHLRVRDIEAGKVTIDPIPESEGVSYGYGFVPSSAEFLQSQSVSPSVTEEAGLKAVDDTNEEQR